MDTWEGAKGVLDMQRVRAGARTRISGILLRLSERV